MEHLRKKNTEKENGIKNIFGMGYVALVLYWFGQTSFPSITQHTCSWSLWGEGAGVTTAYSKQSLKLDFKRKKEEWHKETYNNKNGFKNWFTHSKTYQKFFRKYKETEERV